MTIKIKDDKPFLRDTSKMLWDGEPAAAEVRDISPHVSFAQITSDVVNSLENPRPIYWWAIAICVFMIGVGVACEFYQYRTGLGVSNKSNTNVWGVYIASFVFWVGVSHAGTLLSALLHLTHSDWRKSVFRYAEAMTTFALMTAGLFVLVHLGRLWQVYYVMPYPNERGVWSNFQSPLVWDMFVIGAYLTCSSIFLYTGMIPDLAVFRDNIHDGWRKKLYTFLAMGWQGTDRHWRNFRVAYLTLSVYLIILAVSGHSVVSSDFAMSQQPGFHITSFPPYFVVGALYSGNAALITVFIILRFMFRYEQYLNMDVLRKLVRLTFALAMIWTYLHLIEMATVWYGHDTAARDQLYFKATGAYAGWWWLFNFLAIVCPWVMAFRRWQTNLPVQMVLSLLLNVGMWLERWMIIAPTLGHSHYPWTFDFDQWPSFVQWGILFGSFGWFSLLILIFCKVFPAVSMYELKELAYARKMEAHHAPVGEPATKGAH